MSSYVKLFTDGACSGNPGPGGWAVCWQDPDGKWKHRRGKSLETTNNRMELSGAIAALSALTESCAVTLYTDSQYIERAVNEHWLDGWKKRGWRRREGPVKNLELWQELDRLLGEHSVAVRWVKGHAENEYNNRCDALAVRRRDEYAALREGKR